MNIWFDFSNSPHPLPFAPGPRRLQEAGHDLVLTARDDEQTVEFARERWPTSR
jgi:predicted glycosyltransferase